MKRNASLLLSTLVVSSFIFESAFANSKIQAANKQGPDQLKIKLVKAKNVKAPSIQKTAVVAKTTTPIKTSTQITTAKKPAIVVSTKSAPKIAATTAKTNQASTTSTASAKATNTASDTSTVSSTTAAPATTSVTNTATTAAPSFVSFNISTGAMYMMGAEAPKDGKRSSTMIYDVWPALTIGPVKSILLVEYGQDMNDSKDSDWAIDPQLFVTAAKPIAAGDYLNLSPGFFAIFPAMKSSREVNQLKYSIGFNTTFALNTKTMGWDGFVLNYQPGYLKNENEFSTSTAGAPLTSYRIRQRINFWAPISASFVFKTRFQLDSNFSYENVVRNNFVHFQQVDYRFLEKYSVYVGHTNSGPTLKGENYEDNLKFYDGTSSAYYLGLWADF